MDFLQTLPLVRVVWNWFKTKADLNREQDVAIFTKLNDILDESRLDTILNHDLFSGHILLEETRLLGLLPI